MTKLRPEQVEDWITEKANRAFSRHLQFDQGRYAAANPVATARMASSWRIGSPEPDASVEPPRDSPGAVEIKKYSGKIEMDGTWHLSNNVPYAVPVAKDPKYAKGGDGGSDWFDSISNASRGRLEEELRQEFRGQ